MDTAMDMVMVTVTVTEATVPRVVHMSGIHTLDNNIDSCYSLPMCLKLTYPLTMLRFLVLIKSLYINQEIKSFK